MKIPCLLLAVSLFIFSCKLKPSGSATIAKPDSASFVYPVKHLDYWINDTSNAHIIIALKAIKAFEKNDTTEMARYFTDSVMANFDGGVFRGSRREFVSAIGAARDSMAKVNIKVYDWEAVTSKDRKEAWVTTWLSKSSTDKKGKADSIEYVLDMQFKDSLIVKLDEYTRHLRR